MTARLPIIQVGAGHWGRSWAHVVHQHPDAEMVALVDRDERAAVLGAAEIGLAPDRCFGTLEGALSAAPAAAVLVVTPPEEHESVTLTALSAGRHCLVEKPIANNVAAAQRMIDATAVSGRTVMISQNYRFRRGPRTVQRLIAAGTIGAVQQVRIDFARDHEFDGFMVEIPEPLVARWLIHQFDLQRAVLGAEFTELRARSWNPSWSRFAGNAACLVELRSPSGLEVIYTGSWVARGPATTDDGNWRIEGREGAIVWCGDEIVVYPAAAPPYAVPFDVVGHEDRAGVLAAFVTAVRTGTPPETAPERNLPTLQLLLAALAALDEPGWVDVRDAATGTTLLAASPSVPYRP